MVFRTAFAILLLSFTTASAPAGEPRAAGGPAVLELYTSQGCSSCPPADAMLRRMAKSEKIIGLTFSVDYWDYLGWKDTLGRHQHTERQRAYAHRRGDGQVYTPQLIVNGMLPVVGGDREAIEDAIGMSRKALQGRRVPLELRERGGVLVIEAGAEAVASASSTPLAKSKPGRATIWLALVRRHVEVEVERGENRGRVLHYVNAVRALTPVGMWNGAPVTLRLPKAAVIRADSDAAIALIQVEGPGPIIGAAILELR